MSDKKSVMALLLIVESEKGKKLIQTLKSKDISTHFQCTGYGTAPTEMMDIFGLGTRDKDIVISFAAETTIKELMLDFGGNFSSYSKYGGLMIVIKLSAINRLICEVLNHNTANEITQKEGANMKNEHHHNLVFISVSQGYTDMVMETAKKAGATGGTVIRTRLAESEKIKELTQLDFDEEREIICILAPQNISEQIMQDVNAQFGLRSDARGILCAIPVEKAYKI
jgi:hypothetical protein